MSNLPLNLSPDLSVRLAAALDRQSKIVRALDALGPVAGRDVVVVDASGGPFAPALAALGARLIHAPLSTPLTLPFEDGAADAVVGFWSTFRGPNPDDLAEVDRVLRPDGRLLAVHDYGRDDVSRLHGERPEYGPWSHRSGPFLTGGFRLRVLHCWWDFDSMADLEAFLCEAFADRGSELAASLKRPRLSYNVAIYHRPRGGVQSGIADVGAAGATLDLASPPVSSGARS